jgi:hypothetical protein
MPYVLMAVPYLLQLLCLIHIVKRGRDSYWIYIVLFVPYVGGIAYLLVEILPSIGRPGSVGSIVDIVSRTVNPSYKIKEYEGLAALTPTFQNKKLLADEYLECGYFEKAERIYSSILEGVYKNDAEVLLKRAKALYALGAYADANAIIERLDAEKHEYKTESEILIKLKVKENVADVKTVYDLYESTKDRFRSFEIYYYFIDYLIRHESGNQAMQEIAQIETVRKQLDKNRVVYDRRWVKMIERQKKTLMNGKAS